MRLFQKFLVTILTLVFFTFITTGLVNAQHYVASDVAYSDNTSNSTQSYSDNNIDLVNGNSSLVSTTALTTSTINGNYYLIRNQDTNHLLNTSTSTIGASVNCSNYAYSNRYLWKITDAGNGYSYIESAINSDYIIYVDTSNSYTIKLGSKSSSSIATNCKQWSITPNTTNYGDYIIAPRVSLTRKLCASSSINSNGAIASSTSNYRYWVLEPTIDNASSLDPTYDYMAPPISSYGTNRSAQYDGHKGIDIASSGVPKKLYSISNGTAVYYQNVGLDSSGNYVRVNYGNFVIIKPYTQDSVVYYGHLSSFSNGIAFECDAALDEGFDESGPEIQTTQKRLYNCGYSNVVRGQVIGISGNTGMSSGIHLHFEEKTDASIIKTGTQITDITPFTGTSASISSLDEKYKLIGDKIA